MGCPQGAKASTDLTYWPWRLRRRREAPDALAGAEITVATERDGRGVVYYDAEGPSVRQLAHVVVLACNGIGTRRLLLNSRSTLFPTGSRSERAGGQEPDAPIPTRW